MNDHAPSNATHGSFRSYLVGFGLSVVLTVIPFALVMTHDGSKTALILVAVFALGAAQILVHIHYFLHVTLKAEAGWQALSLLFTTVLLVIVIAGSLWVMLHLEDNMMPAHEQIERVRNLP
ncbi:MAG: cytochrome o ubiquinol oxidase subunit IV [Pseudomonadota bacterium]